jgi:hypothetical protein
MKPVHRRAAHPAHHRRRSLNPSEVGNGGNQQRQEEGGGGGGDYKDGGNGARKFSTSRASLPVHPAAPKITRASSSTTWLWKNKTDERF